MKAFLLAAGVGTRLRPYTDKTPKCLMPIQGIPLLEIWITLLEKNNINEVLINTHHLADQVEAFVKRIQKKVRIKITTKYEKNLLGSGGTILSNRNFVDGGNDFLIIYADNLTNIDLKKMIGFHSDCKKKGGILTMGLFHAPDPRACGIAELDKDKKVINFIEKPKNPLSDLANGGIYITSPRIYEYFPEPVTREPVIDFGYHILPQLKEQMYGYEIEEYLKDIGTIEAYDTARREWADMEVIQ